MAYTTIDKPTDYFNTKLYTGNATDNHAITGVNFQPDLVWVKGRSEISSQRLNDVVRGAGTELLTNTTDAEYTYSPNTSLKSFDSDGFTLGTDNGINKSSVTYASWNWLAGGTASSNTDGSITSSVSANTTSGFSIVSYTGNGSAGATVGHGLGTAPKMIIVKGRSFADDWLCYHSSLGNGKYIILNKTNAEASSSLPWNSTSPTSSVFSLGASGTTNNSGQTQIAYCFAEKKGFSKFGSYTGNGSTDGTFVYTGFKPAWVMTKRTSLSATGWVLMDNKRETFNDGATNYLIANDSVAETSASFAVDFLSNGFKPRTNSGGTNTSGETYIYMAFAENPFTTSTGIPSTAR